MSEHEIRNSANSATRIIKFLEKAFGILQTSLSHLNELPKYYKGLKGQINNATIDISNLENGMYFLKINDNQKVFTKKFIKK